jgi:HEAT repeat protein
MLRWIMHFGKSTRYHGHTAADWYGYYRRPSSFAGDLASAVPAAIRETLGTKNEVPDLEVSPLLCVLLTTDSREGIRCLAAIKIGLDRNAACESGLLAALYDQSEIVRRTVALALLALDTVRGLTAVVAGSRHGHAVRTEAAHRLGKHGSLATEAIPGLLMLLRDREINWRSHAAAAAALAAIGEPAIPWLLHAFHFGDSHVRRYAALSLKDMDKTPELRSAIDEELAMHNDEE